MLVCVNCRQECEINWIPEDNGQCGCEPLGRYEEWYEAHSDCCDDVVKVVNPDACMEDLTDFPEPLYEDWN